jgi:hypothetical protein
MFTQEHLKDMAKHVIRTRDTHWPTYWAFLRQCAARLRVPPIELERFMEDLHRET